MFSLCTGQRILISYIIYNLLQWFYTVSTSPYHKEKETSSIFPLIPDFLVLNLLALVLQSSIDIRRALSYPNKIPKEEAFSSSPVTARKVDISWIALSSEKVKYICPQSPALKTTCSLSRTVYLFYIYMTKYMFLLTYC